MMIDEQLF